jgi:glycosyltransferase involved in cell wall biosynthesis
MKILLTAEFYYPSIGGAQKVVSEIAERLAVNNDLKVYIATSQIYKNQKRKEILNSVNIRRFNIKGNYVENYIGEKNSYIKFLTKSKFDVILFYAAQQWTFDLALDILKEIKSKKIFCPCGFSRINKIAYKSYFLKIAERINIFDKVIFHSNQYLDYYFLKKFLKKKKISIIPNAADINFLNLKKNKIFNDYKIFLNVSNLVPGKRQDLSIFVAFIISIFVRKKIKFYFVGNYIKASDIKKKLIYIIFYYYLNLLRIIFNLLFINKEIIFLENLTRDKVLNLYKKSDYFLFTSRVECSPIVIFEALASGLPFFSLKSGNIEEISKKTKAGICKNNFINLSFAIIKILSNSKRLIKMSKNGISNFKMIYNWTKVFKKYENIILK